MKPLRVYDFAEELGLKHNDITPILEKAGIPAKSPSSKITNEQIDVVIKALGLPAYKPKTPATDSDFIESNGTERQIIEQAFEETIKNLFSVFFDSYTIAKGDPAGEQQAEATFRSGILHARHIRDRALAIIP